MLGKVSWYTVAIALGLALSLLLLAEPHWAQAHSSAWPSGAQSENPSARPADDGPGYEAPPPSALGGPFSLTDHTGRAVTDHTFRGKWMLIFFGFTGCREACPVGLQNMALALDALGKDGDNIQPLYVDFDFVAPERIQRPSLSVFQKRNAILDRLRWSVVYRISKVNVNRRSGLTECRGISKINGKGNLGLIGNAAREWAQNGSGQCRIVTL